MKIEANNLTKSFSGAPVLRGVAFGVSAGQTLAILGRSGSGKTTLLKILAGLMDSDNGEVRLDGAVMDKIPPQARGIVYLYQEPLLFPHLTVFENVAFGLRIRKEPEPDIRQKTNEMLARLDLEQHATKKSDQLSGGQRQRVAFGRALIIHPEVLLLDEPFGNLDTETRAEMQQLFKKIATEAGITTLFVTHDLKEAALMGDRFALMENGQLRMFPDLESFVRDPGTGFRAEIEFWKSLSKS